MKSVDAMLKELYSIDYKNNYEISFFCGRWRIKNKKTCEGIDTDAGFSKAKKWMEKDIKKTGGNKDGKGN